jgi:hypothetical protein
VRLAAQPAIHTGPWRRAARLRVRDRAASRRPILRPIFTSIVPTLPAAILNFAEPSLPSRVVNASDPLQGPSCAAQRSFSVATPPWSLSRLPTRASGTAVLVPPVDDAWLAEPPLAIGLLVLGVPGAAEPSGVGGTSNAHDGSGTVPSPLARSTLTLSA